MTTSASTWRLRQQAAQLSRLFADAGLHGTAALEAVTRLGHNLDMRASLAEEAALLSEDLTERGSEGFSELTRQQQALDSIERSIRGVYDEIARSARVDAEAAASSTRLLDELQSFRSLD